MVVCRNLTPLHLFADIGVALLRHRKPICKHDRQRFFKQNGGINVKSLHIHRTSSTNWGDVYRQRIRRQKMQYLNSQRQTE
jgi:hypothetical protein